MNTGTKSLSARLLRLLIARKKEVSLDVRGTSMEPRLHAGEKIAVERVKASGIVEGDVILYESRNTFVLHRLIYRKNGLMIIKGDGNRYADAPVHRRQIMGRVRGRRLLDARSERAALRRLTVFTRLLEKRKVRYCLASGLPYSLYYRTVPRMDRFECTVLVGENGFVQARLLLSGLGYRKQVMPVHVPLNMLPQTKEVWYGTPIHGIPFVVILASEPTIISRYRFLQSILYSRQLVARMGSDALSKTMGIRINGYRFRFPTPRMRILLTCIDFFHHNMRGSHRYLLLSAMYRLHVRGIQDLNGLKKLFGRYYLDRVLGCILRKSFYEKPPLAVFSEKSWFGSMGERMFRFMKLRIVKHRP